MMINNHEVTFLQCVPDGFQRYICEISVDGEYLCELSHEKAVDQIDVNIMDWQLKDPSLPVEVVLKAIEEGRNRLLRDTDIQKAA